MSALTVRLRATGISLCSEAADALDGCAKNALAYIAQTDHDMARIAALEAQLAEARQRINDYETADTSKHPYEKGWQDGRTDAWEAYNTELAEARKDAERYRWLREGDESNDIGVVIGMGTCDIGSSGVTGTWDVWLTGRHLDAAIDKARDAVNSDGKPE